MRLVLLLLLCHAAQCAAQVTASSRHWRLTIDSLECEAARVLAVGARVRYLGPKGPVEAPVARLSGGEGKRYPAKSLAWKRGDRAHAAWLATGGIANLQAEDVGDMLLKFDAGGAKSDLRLEFGDIPAFGIVRKGCERVLRPEEIKAPRPSKARAGAKAAMRVHRARYPCGPQSRLIAAEYPPDLPRQLLVYGRGYLPNAREISLPMGSAPAQPYVFGGAKGEDLIAVETAAQQAIAADFPGLAGPKYFAFNWGLQTAQGGNQVYSIGLYELRPCPK